MILVTLRNYRILTQQGKSLIHQLGIVIHRSHCRWGILQKLCNTKFLSLIWLAYKWMLKIKNNDKTRRRRNISRKRQRLDMLHLPILKTFWSSFFHSGSHEIDIHDLTMDSCAEWAHWNSKQIDNQDGKVLPANVDPV